MVTAITSTFGQLRKPIKSKVSWQQNSCFLFLDSRIQLNFVLLLTLLISQSKYGLAGLQIFCRNNTRQHSDVFADQNKTNSSYPGSVKFKRDELTVFVALPLQASL